MDYYKYKTNGNYQLMGYNTYNSVESFKKNNKIKLVNSYDDIVDFYKDYKDYRQVFISGGKKIYEIMKNNNVLVNSVFQNTVTAKNSFNTDSDIYLDYYPEKDENMYLYDVFEREDDQYHVKFEEYKIINNER